MRKTRNQRNRRMPTASIRENFESSRHCEVSSSCRSNLSAQEEGSACANRLLRPVRTGPRNDATDPWALLDSNQ